ncbi:WD40 domain protein beta Propeller [Dyadobacter fermentans DSM 18053]|uniref:WD40 domain protein beta Propeller n=1 Tax=Dyadobacter fermentans (strain ATCC 700827 / DSM 18053 / CIP 107007 / KCTC 52180 / NS114) TaxID=471854 RepID=C6VTR8_DYAFD|nr:WD40 domain protein beta Propeller [Dyadobacter fermentans DSM 18053]
MFPMKTISLCPFIIGLLYAAGLFSIISLPQSAIAQTTIPQDSAYLGQKPPGIAPVIFARDRASLIDYYEYGSVFSKDGSEFYYAVIVNSKPQIRCIRYEKNGWTAPKVIIASKEYEYNDPFLSPDGKRLYFISDRAADGRGPKKDFDIWYVERKNGDWSDQPVNAGAAINSNKNEYYMSFLTNGTMYFSSNGDTDQATDKNYDIRFSKYANGQFAKSEKLGNSINTTHYEADVFVSPDEQYIIFCSERPGGSGAGDLYISFKNSEGNWENAKNMGPAINTSGYEFCPFVTADGKYLFFSRDGDIFWVSSEVIGRLK